MQMILLLCYYEITVTNQFTVTRKMLIVFGILIVFEYLSNSPRLTHIRSMSSVPFWIYNCLFKGQFIPSSPMIVVNIYYTR